MGLTERNLSKGAGLIGCLAFVSKRFTRTPAVSAAVRSQSAGVIDSRTDLRERSGQIDGLAETVIAPAQEAPIGLETTGVVPRLLTGHCAPTAPGTYLNKGPTLYLCVEYVTLVHLPAVARASGRRAQGRSGPVLTVA